MTAPTPRDERTGERCAACGSDDIQCVQMHRPPAPQSRVCWGCGHVQPPPSRPALLERVLVAEVEAEESRHDADIADIADIADTSATPAASGALPRKESPVVFGLLDDAIRVLRNVRALAEDRGVRGDVVDALDAALSARDRALPATGGDHA